MRAPKRQSLDQCVVVVTGATQPIAEAIIARAAARGAQLILVGENAERLHPLANRCRCDGASVLTVRSASDVRAEAARAFAGRINAWINVFDDDVALPSDVDGLGAHALAAIDQRGGTVINVGAAASACTSRLRRYARRRQLPINVCLVKWSKRSPASISVRAIARSTLGCVMHPRREVMTGRATQVLAALDSILPRRVPIVLRTRPSRVTSLDRKTLRSVTRGEPVVGKSSLYATMARHPWTSLALAGAAALFFGSRVAHAPTVERSRVNT